jgi:replicative DNA helicase Mcm
MREMETTYTDSAILDKFYNISGTGILQGNKYYGVLNSLTPFSTLTINVMEDGIYKFFLLKKEEFKAMIKEAVLRYLEVKYCDYEDVRNSFRNLKINLVTDTTIPMHALNARDHEQTVVTFDCEVIAVEKEKTYVKKCVGQCPLCFTDQEVQCTFERDIKSLVCNNIKCKKHTLAIKKEGLVTDNIQYVYLQQILSDAKNSTPITLRGVLVDDMSGTIYVGQKKRITGMYKSVIDMKKQENINDILIEIMAEQDLEKKNDVCLTESEISKLKNDAKDKDFTYRLTTSFAPLIMGYEDIKFSILLMLAGGYSKVKRNDINLLLVGDPSLAKSELLKECSKVSSKSMYTSGRGASAAGLTIGIVKMENGTQVAQAGVLPLCNEGHACIDEFDKMSTDDRSAMHEGMEQQTVSIAKAGFRMTLPSKTSILAAANPKYGKYDIDSSLIDNINIPVPLVSRFDMIWLIRDSVNVKEDKEKATFILDTFTGDDKSNSVYLTRDQLTSYLNYVKVLKPTITQEAKQKMTEIYQNMRGLSSANDSLAVGIRQLEALARLATAHAKLLFKDKVEISDIVAVEGLMKRMFTSLGVQTDKEFNQAGLMVGAKENKEQLANRIWTECEDESKHVSHHKFISKLSATDKFTENDAEKLFGNWEKNNYIAMAGGGKWKKI